MFYYNTWLFSINDAIGKDNKKFCTLPGKMEEISENVAEHFRKKAASYNSIQIMNRSTCKQIFPSVNNL